MSDRVRAIVAIAGQLRPDGNVFTEEALRGGADAKKHLFYDEATKSLVYEGPAALPETEHSRTEAAS